MAILISNVAGTGLDLYSLHISTKDSNLFIRLQRISAVVAHLRAGCQDFRHCSCGWINIWSLFDPVTQSPEMPSVWFVREKEKTSP